LTFVPRSRALTLALALAAAACGADSGGWEARGQEIIGGEPATGEDRAVGILLSWMPGGGLGLCSAAMITTRVVLTAAHCVDRQATHEIWFADSYHVRRREFQGLMDAERRVAIHKWIHPLWDRGSITAGSDIALLLLDKPVPASIPPLPWNRVRLVSGRTPGEVRMVGFGHHVYDDEDPLFVKLTARNSMSSLGGAFFEVAGSTHITCHGDSGGPAFLTIDGAEVVAGITSYGDVSCSAYGAFTRVDLYLADIDAFIAAHDPQAPGGCDADGTCGYLCDAPDPDCPCAGDGVCGTACPDPAIDPDCPPGCGGGGACVREGCPVPDPDCGEKPLGSVCATNDECADGRCQAYQGGHVCSTVCGGGTGCPSGYSCEAGMCLPAGGCGCAAGASRGGSWGWLLALAVVLTARRLGARPQASGLRPQASGAVLERGDEALQCTDDVAVSRRQGFARAEREVAEASRET
jgi:hypothetical protein